MSLRASIREIAALVAAGVRLRGPDERSLLAAATRWSEASELLASLPNTQHAYGCTIYYGGACACGMDALRALMRDRP